MHRIMQLTKIDCLGTPDFFAHTGVVQIANEIVTLTYYVARECELHSVARIFMPLSGYMAASALARSVRESEIPAH